MCYHDMPAEYPPLDWSGLSGVAIAVAAALAILALSNFMLSQLHRQQAIQRHAVTASAAVEPQVWR